jgi:hypothetical protein
VIRFRCGKDRLFEIARCLASGPSSAPTAQFAIGMFPG